jgi:hypothetical protein
MRSCDACALWREKAEGWGHCNFPHTRMFVQIPMQNGVGVLLTAPDFGCIEFQGRTGATDAA